MAASSSRRRLSYATNLDYPEAGAFAYGEYGDNDEYGYGSTSIRGATTGAAKKAKSVKTKATKAPKTSKSKGMSKGYFGKDCPMSRKADKSTGKGKSPKSGEPTMIPSESPSEEPSHSGEPSSSPSISLQPSWPWCQESEEPSASFSPKGASEPIPNAQNIPVVPGETAGGRSVLCENRGALYDGSTINIVDAARGSDAVAGVASTDFGTSVEASDTDKYNVDIVFAVTDGSVSSIGEQMDETISPPTSLALVDCTNAAQLVAVDHFNSVTNSTSRRLEKDGDLAVIKNWVCAGSEEPCGDFSSCAECSTSINYVGDLNSTLFEARLKAALLDYLQMLDNVAPGLYPRQTLTDDNIQVKPVSSDVNGIIDSEQSQKGQGARAGPFIGAATGMLAVLLLLVLFVRRRNRFDEQVSHLKLDDDDTFYNGSEATGIEHEYNTRDIHIVGEGDSVISHWTGFTGRSNRPDDSFERDGLIRGRSTDVHQCSSATCEICDKKRQAGVQFVKTHSPTVPQRIHSLPSDASRDYIAEDTVQL
eukprot:CAMPEP_0116143192 /NCGR_PEP_ID=MMETSP0329-20121206/15318_1 /TAXON_ID=697910 /ORGANISM="Pseudo-nitzschia arenysensis, Strain B593" /LENGTH=533 /DNA_ID=CAMNT_0003638493 /DNA_START=153 /DNA_END=1754 /DNA_ORIENTATION=+